MAEPIARERRVLTPAQQNTLARELLEGAFAQVWVEGEVSNFARPASGHLYFTLKDENAQIRCAMFRMKATQLRFTPRNGLKVLVRGRLTLYEARGEFQLVLEHMEEAGEGALRRAFEELNARLAAEGLFEPARKRPLPRFARHLALVTSARGAAVRDVLTVLARRWPLLPVVSAVGHEIDFSLSDFAADLRAATPSAAAELLVPDRAELEAQLRQMRGRLDAAMQRRLAGLAQRSDRAGLRLESLRPQMRLERGRHRLAMLGQRLDAGLVRRLEQRRQRLELLARTLASVSPLATLARGYAVLREHDSGRVLRRAAQVQPGQRVDAQLAEGRLSLRVDEDSPPG